MSDTRPRPARHAAVPASTPAIAHVLGLPSVPMGQWPTPLQSLSHPTLGQILVKRDDLCGIGGEARSGVKARKLSGLFGTMASCGRDRLWMSLGNITNLGPLLMAQAATHGISVTLDLVNDPPLRLETRQFLHAAYAEQPRLRGPSYGAAALRLLGQLIAPGPGARQQSLAVPPSPAHPAAILGVARGYLEMAAQAQAQFGRLPSSVYLASASGSSVAGLALGEALRRAAGDPPVRIVAVQVVPEPLRFWLPVLFAWTRRWMRPHSVPWPQITVIARPEHRHYGRFTADHETICNRVEKEHDLRIDPIYGAKAWNVMERDAGDRDDGRALKCFWHCGYTPIWRDLAQELRL
jgi:1-aminocyclopropane-1-carboxylate deaminase/D-cysteine desulfhydrase-like pyridoxal-dependent ACC family enzyme